MVTLLESPPSTSLKLLIMGLLYLMRYPMTLQDLRDGRQLRLTLLGVSSETWNWEGLPTVGSNTVKRRYMDVDSQRCMNKDLKSRNNKKWD